MWNSLMNQNEGIEHMKEYENIAEVWGNSRLGGLSTRCQKFAKTGTPFKLGAAIG